MDCQCQCGAVRFKTPLPKPLALYICHCTECRRATGSAFGTSAIFPRFVLPRAELLSCYTRPVPSGHLLYCYFCRACGTRLVHASQGKNVVSIKGGCIDGLDWRGAVHIWTKSAMVPIPEGSEKFDEEPDESEYCASLESLNSSSDSSSVFSGGTGGGGGSSSSVVGSPPPAPLPHAQGKYDPPGVLMGSGVKADGGKDRILTLPGGEDGDGEGGLMMHAPGEKAADPASSASSSSLAGKPLRGACELSGV